MLVAKKISASISKFNSGSWAHFLHVLHIYIYNTRFRPFFLLVSFLDLLQWVPCFIVSIVVLFLLHVIVACAGRHMELEPSAKHIGWVLRNQNGLSRPNSFWTSSAAKT